MKFRSEQSALTWLEYAEFLNVHLIGIFGGTVLVHWFDSYTVGTVAWILSSPLQIFILRNQNKKREIRFNEQLDALRYRGLYPSEGAGTNADVKRLKEAGYKGHAMRLYGELHGTPPYKTQHAVNAL